MHFKAHNQTPHSALINIQIESFGAIERQLPQDLCLQFESEVSISDVLEYVQRAYPQSSTLLERCACAVGEDIIPRQAILSSDTTLVLLSPVAGG